MDRATLNHELEVQCWQEKKTRVTVEFTHLQNAMMADASIWTEKNTSRCTALIGHLKHIDTKLRELDSAEVVEIAQAVAKAESHFSPLHSSSADREVMDGFQSIQPDDRSTVSMHSDRLAESDCGSNESLIQSSGLPLQTNAPHGSFTYRQANRSQCGHHGGSSSFLGSTIGGSTEANGDYEFSPEEPSLASAALTPSLPKSFTAKRGRPLGASQFQMRIPSDPNGYYMVYTQAKFDTLSRSTRRTLSHVARIEEDHTLSELREPACEDCRNLGIPCRVYTVAAAKQHMVRPHGHNWVGPCGRCRYKNKACLD